MQKLYRYMDKTGSGDIGYPEFTLLSEERWRDVDPFQRFQENVEQHDNNKKTFSSIYRHGAPKGDDREPNVRNLGVKVND